MPRELMGLIESLRDALNLAFDSVAPASAERQASNQATLEKEEVARLVAHARATASFSGCGRNALSLMSAQLNLVTSIRACVAHNRLALNK